MNETEKKSVTRMLGDTVWLRIVVERYRGGGKSSREQANKVWPKTHWFCWIACELGHQRCADDAGGIDG